MHYALALAMGILAVGWYAFGTGDIRYPYTPDSAIYIDAARHLLDGKGLVTHANLGEAELTSPLALFPPGFPILLAALTVLTGAEPAVSAIAIGWISWALVPVALLFALCPLLERRAIHVISALVVTSPGLAETGWLALSDIAFLLLAILSIGFLLRSTLVLEKLAPAALMASGILAGSAYLLRNSGTALFAAAIFTFGVLVLIRTIPLRTAAARLAWWGTGCLLTLLPLWIRNLHVFGALQPYQMPPSELGLVENTRSYLQAMLLDLSASPAISMLAWDGLKLALVLAIAAAAISIALPQLRNVWVGSDQTNRLGTVLLAAYAAAGACMVILARSLYEWGETINLRHVIQYDWAVLALGAIALGALKGRSPRIVLGVAAIALGAARWGHNEAEIDKERAIYAAITEESDPIRAAKREANAGVAFTNKMKLIAARNQELMDEIRSLPASTILVSNFADVLRIETSRVVHPLWLDSDCNPAETLRELRAKTGDGVELRVLVFPKNELLHSGCWAKLSETANGQGSSNRVLPPVLTLGAEVSSVQRAERR